MEALKTPFSAVFSTFMSPLRSPRSKAAPPTDDDPDTSAKIALSEKCELRVEGMTCGACVEVRILLFMTFHNAKVTDGP